MKEMVALNKGRQSRFVMLNEIAIGRVPARKAAEVLGLSLRHVRRVLGYRSDFRELAPGVPARITEPRNPSPS